MDRRFKAVLMLAGAFGLAYALSGGEQRAAKEPEQPELYRLVHAIGNYERINARNITKRECESRKSELKIVAETIGAGGSITCLPESLFED